MYGHPAAFLYSIDIMFVLYYGSIYIVYFSIINSIETLLCVQDILVRFQ